MKMIDMPKRRDRDISQRVWLMTQSIRHGLSAIRHAQVSHWKRNVSCDTGHLSAPL